MSNCSPGWGVHVCEGTCLYYLSFKEKELQVLPTNDSGPKWAQWCVEFNRKILPTAVCHLLTLTYTVLSERFHWERRRKRKDSSNTKTENNLQLCQMPKAGF